MLHHKQIWHVILALITSVILASVALPLPRDNIRIANHRAVLGVGQADAEEPSLDGWEAVKTDKWTSGVLCAQGDCRPGYHNRRHTFDRPSNAQMARITLWWVPSGKAGDKQDNEAFTSNVGLTCPDFGDRLQDARLCGTHNQRAQDDKLTIKLTHSGYTDTEFGRTAGSIKARVYVTWYVPKSSRCQSVSQTLTPNTMQVSGTGTGEGIAWRIVDTTTQMPQAHGTGRQATFSFTAQYQRTYQLQFQDVLGKWSTDACTFSFQPPPTPEPDPAVCHTVSVDIDHQTKIIRGNGTGQGIQWKVAPVDLAGSPLNTLVQGRGNYAGFTFTGDYDTPYQLFFQNDTAQWSNGGCAFSFEPPPTPDPAVCHTVTADINHQTQIVRGNGTGQGSAWYIVQTLNASSDSASLGETVAHGQGNDAGFTFKGDYDTNYQLFFQNDAGQWSDTGCPFSFDKPRAATCLSVDADLDEGAMTVNGQGNGVGLSWRVVTKADDGWQIVTEPAINMSRKLIGGTPRKLTPEFSFEGGDYDQRYQLRFLGEGGRWSETGCDFTFSETPPPPDPQRNEYQTIMGPVAFGDHTPYLEPGKESFDGARSIMVNIEYLEDGQGDLVYRFNGQEMSGITASLFNAGGFRQIEITDNRAKVTLDDGITKIIAYQHHQEEGRIFQSGANRWIHPLDQPFEFKSDFALQLHGPPGKTETLVYGFGNDGFHFADVTYDETGQTVIELSYVHPGLIGIYPADLIWTTVEQFTATDTQMRYAFAETGLHFYRVVDAEGQTVSDGREVLLFEAQPGKTYFAQLVYPETSLFVGLYDAMGFVPPEGWLMPVDAEQTHVFEFHADYHRLPDPDPLNPHIQGDVVIEQLYLLNATASVAQEFPYARRDNVLPGVNIVGIPDVSMVAFCQRPGWHEVVYWGGWENESYYTPDRSWIVSEDNARQWSAEQQGDCIDAAHRINMLLAREGLRTDHTWRHHGKTSQGYQMCSQRAWSPYNLVGLKPPHIGQLLTPGTVLPYYVDEADLLFWGWDLDTGGLAHGLDQAQLSDYLTRLGPVQYVDHTNSV